MNEGNRSKISRLPKKIKQQVDLLIANGATIDELTAYLKDYNVSRSSVGRYSQQAKSDIMAKIKNQLDLSAAWGEGLELDEENKQDRQVLSMLRYLINDYQTRAIHEETLIEPKEMRALGQAMKDIILSRAKVQDIAAKARIEALKEATEKAETILNKKLENKKQAADVLGAIKEAYGV